MKRIDSIDFIKGLAILNIILVHTVWWGGYTLINNTSVFKQLPLLFDIPVFFFVTGLLQSYKSFITFKKTVSTFLKQYSLYILIVGIWVLLSLLSYDPPQLANILNAIFLVSFKQSYPVEGIALSIWFFKAYFGIIFFSYFLSKIQHKWIKLLIWLFGLSILYYFRDASDIGLALYYTFFYYIFVFAGKFLWALKFKNVVVFCLLIITVLTIASIYYIVPGFSIQVVKFPPAIFYLIISSLSIEISILIKNNYEAIKRHVNQRIIRFVNILGAKSVYIFYGQAFSGTLIIRYINDFVSVLNNKPVAFLCALIINVTLALVFSLCIWFIYEKLLTVLFKHIKSICYHYK